ncbi:MULTISPECIES: flagellar export chaperone FliS [Pseudomonas]|uniref:Flagellar secretion chaperone FliS n=1 Tax=Pseudomonas eucalypticola TaxID=2599595 RepID=A0A7D5HVE9_9PSED|nr:MULTISPECIES: flagellar export chaperone FliS [Pseudomonas]QKZ03611.1 flagellar export chaperone FliS [Pseudomonas eucalypticola]
MNRMAALRQYRNVNTQSEMVDASPHRLIQLLMEGGLSRIAQARGCMERGELAQKGVLLSKAQNILAGLRDGLDFEKGEALAVNYAQLYDYMTRRLVEANRVNSVEMLDEVSGLLLTVKMGWDAIDPANAAPAAP